MLDTTISPVEQFQKICLGFEPGRRLVVKEGRFTAISPAQLAAHKAEGYTTDLQAVTTQVAAFVKENPEIMAVAPLTKALNKRATQLEARSHGFWHRIWNSLTGANKKIAAAANQLHLCAVVCHQERISTQSQEVQTNLSNIYAGLLPGNRLAVYSDSNPDHLQFHSTPTASAAQWREDHLVHAMELQEVLEHVFEYTKGRISTGNVNSDILLRLEDLVQSRLAHLENRTTFWNRSRLEAPKAVLREWLKTKLPELKATLVAPLHRNIREHSTEGIKAQLVQDPGQINFPGEDGFTALHLMCSKQSLSSNAHLECLAACLNQGADVHAKDATGSTPMHTLAHTVNIVVSTSTSSVTAEQVRAYVDALKAKGADMNARDAAGQTPADLAPEPFKLLFTPIT